MNPSARQLIPIADLGSPALDVPTVLRARQAYPHGPAIRVSLDGGEQIAAAAPLYPLASLAAAQIVAWLADDVTAAA